MYHAMKAKEIVKDLLFTSNYHKNGGTRQHQETIRPTITMEPRVQRFLELDAANQTIAGLKDDVRRLKEKIQSLEQGQGFRSHDVVAGAPHDKMQQRLNRLRTDIQAWTWMLFGNARSKEVANMSMADLLTPELQLSEFGEALKNICHDDTKPEELQDVKFQDAIAAIVSNLVVGQAVMNPLAPCTLEMKNAVQSAVYKIMSSSDALPEHRRAAKMWQASYMKLYNSSVKASDGFGTAQEKALTIGQHINLVIFSILATLEPAFGHYQPRIASNEAWDRKLRYIIRDATDIGRDLSELHSGLVLMDKAWLASHYTDHDGFISLDTLGSRVDPKTALSEGERAVKGKLSLVLFPGLLKYGSDDGSNWDSWTVWIPTKIQLTDVAFEGHQLADQMSHIDSGIGTRTMAHGEITQPQAAVLKTGDVNHDSLNTPDQYTDMAYGNTDSSWYLSGDLWWEFE